MTITIAKIIASFILIIFVSYFSGRLLVTNREGKFMISTANGLITLWGLFFLICMPMVYLGKTLTLVMKLYLPVVALITLAGVIYSLSTRIFGQKKETENTPKVLLTKEEMLYLGLFLGIVLFQLYKTAFYAVNDGDDAFYVATATFSNAADSMYTADPYTGFGTTMPFRYALAPFPIFLAMIARITNLSVATVAHVVVPLAFTLISYSIYNAIAKCLFKEKRAQRYMFMTLLAVFAMFANYSINTAETFMLTRSRQGKEALAAIVMPYLFFMFFEIADGGLKKIKNVIFLLLLSLGATLCSLFGNIVCEIVYFGLFIYLCINKATLREKLTLIVIAIPNACVSLLYLLLR